MTFLCVLVAIFIERALEQYRPARRHAWFSAYCRRLTGISSARWLLSRPWGAVASLLPVVILVAWLQALSADLGGLFSFAFGTAVLLYSLGPHDLGDDTEAFLAARDQGDDRRATAMAQQMCFREVPEQEPLRSFAVARAVVVLANRQLTGPIFWFVLFGAVGAATYRLIQLFAEHLQAEDCPSEMKRCSDEIRHIADWAPARLTAFGYAVAGNFDAVAHAWRSFDYEVGDGPLNEAEQLLAGTGLAALDTFPSDADDLIGGTELTLGWTAVPPVVEDALALVWRNLAIWVAAIGAGSLVAALA